MDKLANLAIWLTVKLDLKSLEAFKLPTNLVARFECRRDFVSLRF